MFSYLHGIRPNARRTASSQVQSSQQQAAVNSSFGGLQYTSQHYSSVSVQNNIAAGDNRTSSVSLDPPVLPPIPRVASQYGPPGKMQVGAAGDSDDIDGGREYRTDERQQTLNEDRRPRTAGPTPVEASVAGSTERTYKSFPLVVSPNYQTSQFQRPSTGQGDDRNPRKKPNRSHTEPGFNVPAPSGGREGTNSNAQSRQLDNPSNTQVLQATSMVVGTTKQGKAKLTLRNPMSILGRRRTAQAPVQASDNAYLQSRPTSASRSKLPDDYDPRIRGKVVHDFSAPRPIRSIAPKDSQLSERGARQQNLDAKNVSKLGIDTGLPLLAKSHERLWESRSSPERQHTPIFKEHFGDEIEPWRFDSNDRRNQHTTGLLDRMSEHEPNGKEAPLPPFARNFPVDIAKNLHMDNTTFPISKSVTPPKVLKPVRSNSPERSQPHVPSDVTPTTSPPKSRSRATSTTDPPFQSAGLPKHLKSNASRFSFDLAGVGSAAQEKLLEDKHRQKSARRARESNMSGVSNSASIPGEIDEDDDFAYDDMDFDDDLEERIPGVNADAEEHTSFDYSGAAYNYTDHTPPASSQEQSSNSQGSARSLAVHSFDLGFTQSQPVSTSKPQHQTTSWQIPDSVPHGNASALYNLSNEAIHSSNGQLRSKPHHNFYEDDLYFDDGMIDDFDNGEAPDFDESVFDDDTSRIYGLPLRDLQPLPVLLEASTADTSQQSTRPISAESVQMMYDANSEAHPDADRQSMPPPTTLPLRKSSLVNRGSSSDQSARLTQNNLEAYHSALALATDRAAREGRFDRKLSIDETVVLPDLGEGRKARVSFDEQQMSQLNDTADSRGLEDKLEDFDFDDEQDDDAIIAAANAEALENDDEGFYGQEFGFFAHANGSGEATYANGGYFGPAGMDGIKRSHSGKANFQEPSLTPITERSEWSQRNSMISMAMQGAFSPSLQNPGLAQLADAMQYEDDNMSLSALLKLRRGAFGGSNGSLRSSASQRSGSPQRTNAQPLGHMAGNGLSGSHLAGSSYSLASMASDEDPRSGSPTLTLQTQGPVLSPQGVQHERSSGSDSSPKRRGAVRGGQGHSRNSSGAESVSYVTEMDEDGAKRWVLEKRRMVEGGGIEILGRQIVEGGRI